MRSQHTRALALGLLRTLPDELVHSFNLDTEQDDLYNLPPSLCAPRDHQPSSSIQKVKAGSWHPIPGREAAPCSTPATHLAPKAAVFPPGFTVLILGLMVFMGP